jgi:2,3-bisphosphoglycerate-independent phosphoglycerate mutase
VEPILEGLKKHETFRVMVLPDHFTPLTLKTHSSEPVPFVIFSSEDEGRAPKAARFFDEPSAGKAGLVLERGHELMERFIRGF